MRPVTTTALKPRKGHKQNKCNPCSKRADRQEDSIKFITGSYEEMPGRSKLTDVSNSLLLNLGKVICPRKLNKL